MRHRTETTIVTVLLGVNVIVLMGSGLLAGSRRYAGGMGLCFLLAVHLAQCCVGFLLNRKIESCFLRLETIVTGKPAPNRLGDKFVPKSDMIFMLIFNIVTLLLAIHAFNRERWIVLCILLVAFLIGNPISTALTIWLKVKACSKRLEGLVSRDNEGVCV